MDISNTVTVHSIILSYTDPHAYLMQMSFILFGIFTLDMLLDRWVILYFKHIATVGTLVPKSRNKISVQITHLPATGDSFRMTHHLDFHCASGNTNNVDKEDGRNHRNTQICVFLFVMAMMGSGWNIRTGIKSLIAASVLLLFRAVFNSIRTRVYTICHLVGCQCHYVTRDFILSPLFHHFCLWVHQGGVELNSYLISEYSKYNPHSRFSSSVLSWSQFNIMYVRFDLLDSSGANSNIYYAYLENEGDVHTNQRTRNRTPNASAAYFRQTTFGVVERSVANRFLYDTVHDGRQ